MQLIETVTVGSGGAASIEFTSIPQDGVDLVVLVSTREDSSPWLTEIRFNSDSTNRSLRRLTGNASTVSSGTDTRIWARANRSDAVANTFGNGSFYVANYTSSNPKSVSVDSVSEHDTGNGVREILAGLWNDTSAIESVQLFPYSGNFVENSSASIYTIS